MLITTLHVILSSCKIHLLQDNAYYILKISTLHGFIQYHLERLHAAGLLLYCRLRFHTAGFFLCSKINPKHIKKIIYIRILKISTKCYSKY